MVNKIVNEIDIHGPYIFTIIFTTVLSTHPRFVSRQKRSKSILCLCQLKIHFSWDVWTNQWKKQHSKWIRDEQHQSMNSWIRIATCRDIVADRVRYVHLNLFNGRDTTKSIAQIIRCETEMSERERESESVYYQKYFRRFLFCFWISVCLGFALTPIIEL